MPNIKCDICREEVNEDNIESTTEHEAVCPPCLARMWQCADCSELHSGSDYYSFSHGRVCHPCYDNGDYAECDCCSDLISLNDGDHYYDGDYSGGYACSDCGDERVADCSNCGESIIYSECGSDNYHDGQCYDCYHRRNEHIQHYARPDRTTLDATVFRLLENYKPMDSEAYNFMAWFYSGIDSDYERINTQICKGATGVFKPDEADQPKWWKSEVKVTSRTFIDTAEIIYTLINSDTFLSDHKKYGLYHPIRDIFRAHIKYIDLEGNYAFGDTISRQNLGNDYFNYRVDYINKAAIAKQLSSNKTEDNADLRRALNQVFNRAYKNRLPQFIAARERGGYLNWSSTLNKYNTNASDDSIDLQIGFDSTNQFFRDVDEFNNRASSCQSRSNREAYAFGYMDMFVNPHLFALLRNDSGNICGRSVIRLFKNDWSDTTEPVLVAPSRLYLTDYTQSKSDVYVGLFKAINEWATTTFDSHKMIAYRSSRHDTSVRSIVMSAGDRNIKELTDYPRTAIKTEKWRPFWESKPDASDADFTYYRDEDQRVNYQRVRGDTQADYAVWESLYSDSYTILEINND
jgi:hypothetical protein